MRNSTSFGIINGERTGIVACAKDISCSFPDSDGKFPDRYIILGTCREPSTKGISVLHTCEETLAFKLQCCPESIQRIHFKISNRKGQLSNGCFCKVGGEFEIQRLCQLLLKFPLLKIWKLKTEYGILTRELLAYLIVDGDP